MENNNDLECKKIIEKKDYYEILGLKRDASEDEIRKSYKKLAIRFHPDKNKSNLAEDAFKKISHSFNVLSNKDKKANYDKYGTEEEVISRNPFNSHGQDDIDPFVNYLINDRIFSICFLVRCLEHKDLMKEEGKMPIEHFIKEILHIRYIIEINMEVIKLLHL